MIISRKFEKVVLFTNKKNSIMTLDYISINRGEDYA